MNQAQIITKYIAKYAKEGISSNEEIRNKLKEEIIEIDKRLAEVEPLRTERAAKQKALEYISSILQTDKMISDFDDESEEIKDITNKVISFIKENGYGTNRDIISFVGGYNKDAKVIRAIKNLAEQDILTRDKQDRTKIVPGKNWNH